MIPGWVQSQHSSFVRWCNMHLQPSHPQISNLQLDFQDGVALCRLVEAVTGVEMSKVHTSPKLIESYENIGCALAQLRRGGVKLDLVGPEDFVEGNLKMILGFIWQLIQGFTVADISEGGLSASDGLLLWCKRRVDPYGVVVRDFGSHWKDGLALCALIDHYMPDALNFDNLDRTNPRACVELALEAASSRGIPALLDADDILGGPDPKSLVTYLAYWYHTFAPQDQLEAAGLVVEKFWDLWGFALRLRQEYEQRMARLLGEISMQLVVWSAEPDSDSHEKLMAFKRTTRHQWLEERLAIAELFGEITTKLSEYRMTPYTPEHTIHHLDQQWLKLQESELAYTRRLSALMAAKRQKILDEFVRLSSQMAAELQKVSEQVSALGGSQLEIQLEQILVQSSQLDLLKPQLASLRQLSALCASHNIATDERTVHTHESLERELECAERTFHKRLSFIESQIVAGGLGQVSPDILGEFETVFHHFDRDGCNSLDFDQFAAALESLGQCLTESETRRVFDAQATGNAVSLRRFIEYMAKETASNLTLEQARESFKEIAGGKPLVQQSDLEAALLPGNIIEQLVSLMPHTEHGYDYNAYLDKVDATQ